MLLVSLFFLFFFFPVCIALTGISIVWLSNELFHGGATSVICNTASHLLFIPWIFSHQKW